MQKPTFMQKPGTREELARRLERVAAHIAAHLDEPLDLTRLAEVACLSPYHFHRVYRYLMGETTAETLRRNRLHRAAGALVQGKVPIAQIARRAGYGSVAAFGRAFRAAYDAPPAAYRRQGHLFPPVFHASNETEENEMYEVKIEERPPMSLAGLEHQGPYMEIGQAFERLFAWAAGRGLLNATTQSVGIYFDDPESTPAKELRSIAALTLPTGVPIEGEPRPVALAGGSYAVLLHKGPYAVLEQAYRWLYKDWLPQSGRQPADRPCYEVYLNDPRQNPPAEWLTEICLPLA